MSMNVPGQSGAATPAAPATNTSTTLEERAAAAIDQIHADDAAERAAAKTTPQAAPGAQGSTAAPSPAAAAPAPGAASASPERTPEQLAQERRSRLDALHARNRSRVDDKQRQAEGDKATRELERARQELADAQGKLANLVDPSKLDAPTFFGLAEKANVNAQQIGEWMRQRIQNPEVIAEQTAASAAKRLVDPELAAVRAELAKTQQQLQDFQTTQQRAATEAAEQQATSEFCALVNAQAATAPLAAKFLQQHGQGEFYKLAIGALQQVPGADWQGIVDQVEENLASLGSLFGAAAPAPSPGTAPPQHPAAAQANTVSNALAATRSAISADEDFSKMSLDERARRLIESDDW